MDWYINLVIAYPIVTAMAQFAVLGTMGDLISKWIINKKIFLPFKAYIIFLKMAEWALLAVLIKYAFVGFNGFIDGLMTHGYLPAMDGIPRAFAVSAAMNLQFGLLLVIMHRMLDNIIARQNNWANLQKGFYSLVWFWIPAHTVTFALPKPLQIGLAALWSLMLGIILGFYNKKN